MRVIIIGPIYPYRGGIAHFTHFLDQALNFLGHNTQVISFRRQYPAWLYPGTSDQDPSQKETPSNANYILDPLNPLTWHQAVQKIRCAQPDLVVIQWWTTFWSIPFGLIARSLRRKGIPINYLIHNVLPHEARPWDSWLARLALAQADAYLVQTESEKKRLLSLQPDAKVKLHHHPAYPFANEHTILQTEARQRLALPEDSPILLFFGLVRPYKGLALLIQALSILRQSGTNPHLVIAGEFWENKQRYLEQIEGLGLQEHVHLFDRYIPDEQVADFFAAADVLIAPYTAGATQSGAANIARGMGLPMIVTEEVQQGLVEEKSAGIQVVPSNNAAALANAIRSFLQQPQTTSRKVMDVQQEWREFAENLLSLLAQ